MTDWKTLPKIELHLHLEGAAPPALVRRLGAEKGVDLDGVFTAAGAYASTDFTSFLRTYERVSRVFATPEDYCALTEAVLREAAAEGVIYAEVFLSPTSLGYEAAKWRDMLAAIEEGADRAEAATGVACRFIPVGIRHHDPAKAVDLVATLATVPRGRMTGFGLAGDERIGAPRDWAPAFAAAGEAGFRLTAHAGEFGGPESVRGAIRDLGVERIGHGVRAAEDEALMAEIAERGLFLETCPGSNVALGVYPNLAAHPIARLIARGCRLSVSTDDPPFFHTTMSAEYAALAAVHGLGEAAFRGFATEALDAAFADEPCKRRLAAKLGSA